MTKIVGLTGGIGSGKTTVANYFKSFGVPVYIADDAAKEIMESAEVIGKIVDEFGEHVLLKNGQIDRKKLAKAVFNDSEKLQKLNSIVHPKVRKHFEDWIQKHSNFPFIIKEAAILFESGTYKDCDYIITVTSPVETRIERVMKRDNIVRDLVMQRIENQWTDEQRIGQSDYVIKNTSVNETQKEVKLILKKLKKL